VTFPGRFLDWDVKLNSEFGSYLNPSADYDGISSKITVVAKWRRKPGLFNCIFLLMFITGYPTLDWPDWNRLFLTVAGADVGFSQVWQGSLLYSVAV